jgi:hypothetical protein
MKAGVWIVGGICLGTAMLFLIGAFGDTGFGLLVGDSVKPASIAYSHFGYDASLDVQLTSNGVTGLTLLFIGLACLVSVNSGAWKETNNEY